MRKTKENRFYNKKYIFIKNNIRLISNNKKILLKHQVKSVCKIGNYFPSFFH